METDRELYDILAAFLDGEDESNETSSESNSETEEMILFTNNSSSVFGNSIEKKNLKLESIKKSPSKKKHSKPRMVHTDIRESFGIMFANTFNSCDMDLISGMCERYYMPNLAVTIKKQLDFDSKFIAIPGLGPTFIANLIYSVSVLSPDVMTSLKQTLFKSKTGEVSFTFYYTATKVYNVPSILEVLPNMVVEKEQAAGLVDPDASSLSNEVIAQSLENIKTQLPLRRNPVKVLTRNVVKMTTNQFKRVDSFKMLIYNVENNFHIES